MKEIKRIHIMIAIILALLALAIVQWVMLPKNAPPPAKLSAEADQLEELPVLPQIERYNSNAAPSLEELPPFEETRGQDTLEPKDPALSSEKAGF